RRIRDARAQLRQAITNARRDRMGVHIERMEQAPFTSKRFHRELRKAHGQSRVVGPALEVDGNMIYDPVSIAAVFAKHYESVGRAPLVPPPDPVLYADAEARVMAYEASLADGVVDFSSVLPLLADSDSWCRTVTEDRAMQRYADPSLPGGPRDSLRRSVPEFPMPNGCGDDSNASPFHSVGPRSTPLSLSAPFRGHSCVA
ncbi:MAG: hypothetical protein ACXW36_11205, partial [Nitrospira sp.]